MENDTFQVIKYKGEIGIFADSSASVKLTRKILLADSVSKINLISKRIIDRGNEQKINDFLIKRELKGFIKQQEEKHEIEIKNKNREIRIYRIGVILIFLINIFV